MKFFFTTTLLLFIFSFSFSQWKNATPFSASVNDIQFTDRYTGFAAVTATQIGNCSNTSTLNIYKTIDQGENWFLLNTGISASFSTLYFMDSNKGWVGNANNLYNTIDGGQTWTLYSGSLGTGVNDITFTSSQNGFLIGNSGALRKTTNGGSTWQFATSGVTTNLNKIYFFNSQLGFIACQNGQLLRTTNGGGTWNPITTGSSSLRDVYFINANDGFATGYVTNGYSVLKTTDGGLTWNVQQALTLGGYPLYRIIFTSATDGYIASGGQGIFKTIDGGNTWTQTFTMNTINDYWQSISFVDNNIGFVCGNAGRISKTTDGGISWKGSVCGSSAAMYGVWATNKKTAYAAGNSGVILKTKNGGLNWKQKTRAFPTSAINKLYFVNDSLGFACSDSGRILKTNDYGETWNLKPTNSLRFIYDFSFVNKDTGYASSENGIIFKTFDSGETWDSISVGVSDYLKGIFFTNKDTGFVCGTAAIYRTYNAGSTWVATNISNASYLADIVFTNDSLGYCAGGFGKVLFTTDAGLNWNATNNMTTNAEIEEMSAVNDSVIYFARYVSQYFTLDSCKVLGSQSTACLQNNYTMHSISMTNEGLNGYCTGGMSKELVHIKELSEIETIVSTNAYCTGSKMAVACIVHGFYSTGNIINIEMSDATGSFSSPTIIGSYTPIPLVFQSGVATATIPVSTMAGVYRVRAVSTNPVIIGADNGFDITIQSQATPTVSLQSNINSTTSPGSQFVFQANTFAGGLNPTFQWFVNGIDINHNSSVYYTDTLQNNDSVKVILTSNLGCLSNTTSASNSFIASISNLSISASLTSPILCNGQSGVVTVSATGGTPPYAGTGIFNSVAGTHVYTVTDANGITANALITITQPNILTATHAHTNVLCFGTSTATIDVTVVGGTIPYFYQWSGSSIATTQDLQNLAAGNYSILVSDANSCTFQLSNISIAQPLAALTLSETHNGIGCNGNATTTINVTPTGGTQPYIYQWSGNSTTITQDILNAVYGNYNLHCEDANACASNLSIVVDSVVVPTITIANSVLSTSSPSSGIAAWLFNGSPIPNTAALNNYTPTQDGNYSVEVLDSNGCVVSSNIINVIITNVPTNIQNIPAGISVFPNPVNDILNVVCTCSNIQSYSIVVFDLLGKELLIETASIQKSKININNLPSGIYFVKVRNEVRKFVKE